MFALKRCQYCHTALRLNSYVFDREGRYGYRFYCQQHFGMSGELSPNKTERKVFQKVYEGVRDPEKGILGSVIGVDLLDRGIIIVIWTLF